MALKSAGSSPAFPIIKYNHYAYVTNHFNILNSKKLKSKKIIKTVKTLRLVKALHKNGIISNFVITTNKYNGRSHILFNSPYYSTANFYSSIRLVSTPSRAHFMSLKALKLATISIGASTIFLETSQGIITHIDALRLGITGRILCVILYYVFW